ncbi:1-aminocyclopropane-1-carboxylate synthase [Metarhizium robertsii]|uniref:Pyridoxal phosphate-dependent transferase, major domain protein n=2 Tax=Metarhizium robertsii TaxID=568076 RepID=E9F9Y1_METRA|nr:Pyridoxal phosphate-dependent transferase, major domain protein [Metarhizium robertsii ARSEF 23]EFY95481.1 Pyridoxal phosphate-dependent transferase, major domain protein [Metarhizium robertsii ARSEF 23]EXU97652.1 1-aminocyclopropane-1-carboxylate synthase [Metarhizium robertsii]
MESYLSKRSAASLEKQSLPWRFAPSQTYDAEKNPDGLISFGTAENKLITSNVESFVNSAVKFESQQFTYGFSLAGGARFPTALAVHLNEYLRPYTPITADHIKVTGSATPMHEILAWGLADPGDGIMTSRPVYGRFELDFGNRAEVSVVYADTDAENVFDEDVVDKFEDALVKSEAAGVKIRAVLIVNPHNPLGKCYPRNTLVALMKFCQRHNIHLISDEIYACSTFDSGEPSATEFTSILAIDPEGLIDTERLHVTYGFSKDFGSAGLRIGAIITRSKAVEAAIRGVIRFHNPAGPSLAIGAAMLEDRKWCREFVELNRVKLKEAYGVATSGLKDIGVQYLAGSNAGFFLWIDLSPYLPTDLDGEPNAEFALAKKLMANGVFLHPREEHSLKPGWFRMVYTQDPDIVKEGIKRYLHPFAVLCWADWGAFLNRDC